MLSITLVSCVGLKQNQPSPAKDLYKSAWFVKARVYVEQQGWDWYIISAKYGLLHRDRIVEPYELCLTKMPALKRQQWAERVFAQVSQVLPERSTVRLLAGKRYREYLVPLLEAASYTVEIPLLGLGIGQQLAWFNAQ